MRKILKRNENGITLIALVITIIVLLILAGVAISMLSGENGILRQAASSKLQTEKANLAEEIKLAYLSSLTSGKGKVNYSVLNEELEELGFERGEEKEDGSYQNDIKGLPTMIKINGEEYTITSEGNSGKSGRWMYKKDENGRKTIVSNGVIDLPIGTYINYNASATDADEKIIEEKTETSYAGSPTISEDYIAAEQTVTEGNGYGDQTFSNTATTNGWRVIGLDEEKGEILVLSADLVKTTSNTGFYLRGIAGYQFGETQLDKVCSVFGSGYGATGARCVDANDINRITGYNPNNVGVYDPEQTGSGIKFGANTINEYGNEVTYSWTETSGKISWLGTNKITGEKLNSGWKTYGFNYFDESTKTWKNSKQDTTNPTEIAKIKQSYYNYFPYSLTTDKSTTGTQIGLSTTSDEYRTLYFDSAAKSIAYWLATPYTSTTKSEGIYYGIHIIGNSTKFNIHDLYTSKTVANTSQPFGIRPVVSLKSDIKLQYDSINSRYDIIK